MRATVASMVPLLLAFRGWLPFEVAALTIAAQNIALVDLRGAYPLRLAVLLAMTAVFVGAAALGAAVNGHLAAELAATALLAGGAALWRHLSPEYGPSLAVSSTLVFLLTLAEPSAASLLGRPEVAVLVGGLWGIVLQMADWPFRPQHPLRRAVSDSWAALADVYAAMQPVEEGADVRHPLHRPEAEAALRTSLDQASAMLASVTAAPTRPLRQRLEKLNLAAARLGTHTLAFATALEPLRHRSAFAAIEPALLPVLTSLTNLARTVAIAIVSRQPSHLATAEVRIRRLANLLHVLRARVSAHADDPTIASQVTDLLDQIGALLPETQAALRATSERADERAAFSLELLDVETWTLRPLASALNLGGNVDPALVRFALRLAVITMAGVLAYRLLALPHGYWLPFTAIVVLQPDYGATRARAAQRMLGTVVGSLGATALLFLHPPLPVVMAAIAATIFAFGYWLRHNYAVAVVFVTLFIVLLTEAAHPVTIALTAERLASTLAGGGLALLAALWFWPMWERDRFPPILARALEANRTFLRVLIARLADGRGYEDDAILAKRRAESANALVFSSLKRMMGDPQNRQDRLEQAAAIANGNQRLTRALTVIAMHLVPCETLTEPGLAAFARLADDALDAMVRTAAAGLAAGPAHLTPLGEALERFVPTPSSTTGDRRSGWVFAQLSRAGAELTAMLLALENVPPPAQSTIRP